ncbi:hypothetical protein HK105_204830 [Polyrhizophydium stewartii]|uniref:Methyltransferase domain-containing protein n=1 Tax=Polyrhizophydium stewartii TaxID=2732419 RepID=A0ABR4N811_9FUNG
MARMPAGLPVPAPPPPAAADAASHSALRLPAGESDVRAYAARLKAFVDRHGWLADFFAVDFITADYWHAVFPADWRVLEREPLPTLCRTVASGHVEDAWPNSLKEFVRGAAGLALPRSPVGGVLASLCSGARLDKDVAVGMNVKKRHEVAATAALVARIAAATGASHVLDLGAGQGYLSSALAFQYGLHIYAVDQAQAQVTGGVRRADGIRKMLDFRGVPVTGSLTFIHDRIAVRRPVPSPAASPRPLSHARKSFISSAPALSSASDPACDSYPMFAEIIADILDEYPDARRSTGWIVCGLHTCGDLASTMVRTFASECADGAQQVPADAQVKALVNLGCCYQILTEHEPGYTDSSLPVGFPMSSLYKSLDCHLGLHARMVACQASSRWSDASPAATQLSIKKLFFRSVLQKIIEDHNITTSVRAHARPTPPSAAAQQGSSDSAAPRRSSSVSRRGSRSSTYSTTNTTALKATSQGEVAIRTLPASCLATPQTYVRAALERLGARGPSFHAHASHPPPSPPPEALIGDGTVLAYFEWHHDAFAQIAAVWSMRTILADVIESLILVDRYIYLLESLRGGSVFLAPLVDPAVSPRNMALVAIRGVVDGLVGVDAADDHERPHFDLLPHGTQDATDDDGDGGNGSLAGCQFQCFSLDLSAQQCEE